MRKEYVTRRGRGLLALAILAFASARPEEIEPVLAQGFAGLRPTTGFVAQRADDPHNEWRPYLQLWVGSREHADYPERLGRWAKQLLRDPVDKLIVQTRQECLGQPRAGAVEKELGYFVNNITRMQHGTFRRQGFFIGSGVVEAGCKTVIGARCKQWGMFWGEPGAENVLALRCIRSSHRLEDFWKARLNTRAACNDALPLAA